MANNNTLFADQPTLIQFGGPIKGGDESHALNGPIVYCPRCGSVNTEELLEQAEIVVERFMSHLDRSRDVPTYRCRACGGEFALL